MKVFFTLLLIRLRAMVSGYTARQGKKSPAFTVLIVLLLLYVVGVLVVGAGVLLAGLGAVLFPAGLYETYFIIAGTLAFALCIIGSIVFAKKQIYEASDNDLLLSMPIPPASIIGSRMAAVYVINLVYSSMILIPAGVIRLIIGTQLPPLFGVVMFAVSLLIFPLLPMALSCALGALLAVITAKMKNKNFFTIIFTFAFIGVYLVCYSNIDKYITLLNENGFEIGEAIGSVLLPVRHFAASVSSGGIVDILLYLLWFLVPIAIVYILIARSFTRIATTKPGEQKVEYRRRELRVASPLFAIIRKEFARFFSLPVYIINCGLGSVMMTVLTVLLLIKREALQTALNEMQLPGAWISLIVCAGICLCTTMNNTAMVSLSLEGKCLWILRSSPAMPLDILGAKIIMNVIVGAPFCIICPIICQIAVGSDFLVIIASIAVALSCQIMTAVFGMIANLLVPKFDWLNETYAVKQSVSALIGLFGGMLLVAPAVIGGLLVPVSGGLYMLIASLYFLAVSALLILPLRSWGCKVYNSL